MSSHICCFSDQADYKIRYGGKVHRFDWSDMFGPSAVDKQGRILDRRLPDRVIGAISQWRKQGKRVCSEGYCIWRPEPTEVFRYLTPSFAVCVGAVVLQEDRC